MAELLNEMPPKARRTHPWDEWSDGQVRKIYQGTDFKGAVESMRTQIYGKARDLGKAVELDVDRDAKTITFRMIDK